MESFKEWNESTEESGFIDRILLSYPDKTAALVYADWLDEHDSSWGQNYNSHFASYIRNNLYSSKPKISITKSLENVGAWAFPNNVYVYDEFLIFPFSSNDQVFIRQETNGVIDHIPQLTLKPETYLSCQRCEVRGRDTDKCNLVINGTYTYPYEATVTDKQSLLACLIYHWKS